MSPTYSPSVGPPMTLPTLSPTYLPSFLPTLSPTISPSNWSTDPYADYTTAESGMMYLIVRKGGGAIPLEGQVVRTHYTGWLNGFNSPNSKFDSSRDRGETFEFILVLAS